MKNSKRIIRRILIIVLVLIIGFVAFILNETKDEINANLINVEEKLNSFYNENRMAGFAVAVFNKDSIIYKGGFGYADKKNKISYTTKTQQYIASVSKTNLGYVFLCNTGASSKTRYYQINIFRTLASLGDHIIMNDPNNSFWKKTSYKWHNIYSRINGLI